MSGTDLLPYGRGSERGLLGRLSTVQSRRTIGRSAKNADAPWVATAVLALRTRFPLAARVVQ